MKFKSTTTVVLVILAVILLVVAYFTYKTVVQVKINDSAAGQALLGGDDAALRFVSTNGAVVNLDEYLGKKALYINTWASWSPLSKDELIALNEVASEYKDKNIVFIALNRKENKDQATRFLETLPKLDNLVVVIDSQDHFYTAVAGYAMPESILYDSNGNLFSHIRQPQNKEEIKAAANALLEVK